MSLSRRFTEIVFPPSTPISPTVSKAGTSGAASDRDESPTLLTRDGRITTLKVGAQQHRRPDKAVWRLSSPTVRGEIRRSPVLSRATPPCAARWSNEQVRERL